MKKNTSPHAFALRITLAVFLASLGVGLAALSFALATTPQRPVADTTRKSASLAAESMPVLQPLTKNPVTALRSSLSSSKAIAISVDAASQAQPGAGSATEPPPKKSSPLDRVAATTAAPQESASKKKTARKRIKDAGKLVRLTGEVPAALAKATKLSEKIPADTPLTLTIVLNRTDQAGFDRYLYEVYEPHSPSFRQFLTPLQISDRFGPSPAAYDAVLHYFQRNGFKLLDASKNRLTLTLDGTRAQVERAFEVNIGGYRLGNRKFYANDKEPALPAPIASRVQAVIGLSDLAKPVPTTNAFYYAAAVLNCETCYLTSPNAQNFDIWQCASALKDGKTYHGPGFDCRPPSGARSLAAMRQKNALPSSDYREIDGSGQTVGLLEFDTFNLTDVSDFLALIGANPNRINNLSQVHVNGGATPGASEDEVLLDIDDVMVAAPGAHVVVYDAPFTGAGSSFQQVFNAMINGGVTVISNSWTYCEDQTTLADAQSIDALFQTAAASGISVFNAAGDKGSTCLDGSPNTVGVPADSPNGTAVGGSSLQSQPGSTYGSEAFWDGSTATPPTGQGGFGVSQFFPRPSYQNNLTASPTRSVPDLVANADPFHGVLICQASQGGCPSNFVYGGTSGSAPTWAAFAALLNQGNGSNLGAFNPQIYPFANTQAFQNAASMGTDFAHVGLGSPNLDVLYLMLTGQTAGAADATQSDAYFATTFRLNSFGIVDGTVPADGSSQGSIVVKLRDGTGNFVRGKTVMLTANSGNAIITPPSGVATDGTIVFTVTDLTPEAVTFTATDVSDGIGLQQTPSITFATPPAASGGIVAFPTIVQADGTSFSTITVTLQDSLNRGTPGKLVVLSQGSSHSIVNGPNPSVTDANGQIQFTATDVVTEDVTFTATDVTDGNLPVPGSATVSFVNGSSFNCGSGEGVPEPGWSVTSPETGFQLSNNCVGVSGTAWDAVGNLWALDYPTGNLYKFSPAGGIAGPGTLIGTVPGATPPTGLPTCPHGLAFSRDGQHLYLARQWCGGGGDVVEISMADAHIIRNVTPANSIPCATGIATDPISGDLFVTSPCQSGNDVWRIENPDSGTPTLSVYSSPGRAIGLNFTPDGTIWTEAYPNGTSDHNIVKISGTNSPQPGMFTILSTNAPSFAGGVLPVLNPANPGSPQFLIVSNGAVSGANGSVSKVDLTQNPPVITPIVTGGSGEIILNGGWDGCAYASNGDRIDRITAADGTCNFAGSSAGPTLSLTPLRVTPNPLQGSTQTFTATLQNASSQANIPVFFHVAGANRQDRMVRTDDNGQASLSYQSAFSGTDQVIASATVNDMALTSGQAQVTWDTGKHLTFLTLNPSPTSGRLGQAVGVIAALTDVSASPPVPLAGQTVNFALGNDGCSASTNANGIATCQITLNQEGMQTLTATFAGTSQFVGSSASVGFNVVVRVRILPLPRHRPTPLSRPTPPPHITPFPPPSSPRPTVAPRPTPLPHLTPFPSPSSPRPTPAPRP